MQNQIVSPQQLPSPSRFDIEQGDSPPSHPPVQQGGSGLRGACSRIAHLFRREAPPPWHLENSNPDGTFCHRHGAKFVGLFAAIWFGGGAATIIYLLASHRWRPQAAGGE